MWNRDSGCFFPEGENIAEQTYSGNEEIWYASSLLLTGLKLPPLGRGSNFSSSFRRSSRVSGLLWSPCTPSNKLLRLFGKSAVTGDLLRRDSSAVGTSATCLGAPKIIFFISIMLKFCNPLKHGRRQKVTHYRTKAYANSE